MNNSYIRIIQKNLLKENLFTVGIDGKLGSKTDEAVKTALLNRINELPEGWRDWSKKRKAIAYLQLLCKENNIDPGPIDGLYGPRTEDAAHDLRILQTKGSLPRPFVDLEPIIANPHNFPLEREANLNSFYGNPCEIQTIRVPCPWTLRLDWELNKTTNVINIHENLADSLSHILERTLDHYGLAGIKELCLDRYGGSYVCRKKRGSTNSRSTHSWAIAIDWFPSKNKLRWGSDRASLAHPDLDFWWELWEKEGWYSLGRSENRDWMHVQAARRK